MVEARARKAAFLREAVRTLDLAETTVESRRFEELAGGDARRPADLITMRAVRFDREAAGTCGRLLKPGGILLLFASSAPVLPGDGPLKLLRTVLFEATSSSVHVLERV
jgi:16S rRNA G527 N7-methylase RsmG